MMRRICILALLAWPIFSTAAVTVEVVDSFPAPPAQPLAVDQSFYVHLRYTSDTPVRIHVRPVMQDGSNHYITSGSVLLPPGTGETLGWFALRAPGTVTGIRIAADTDHSGYPKELSTVPARLEWKPGGVMTDAAQPAWVAEINRRNEALREAEQRNAAMNDSPFLNLLLGLLLMPLLFGIPVLALVLSVIAPARWTGAWRYAGGLPLLLFAIWFVNLVIAVTRDPTSHNLWPFEMLYWGGFTLAWLAALFVARKWLTGKPAG